DALVGDAPLSRPVASAPSRVELVPRGEVRSYRHRRDGREPAQLRRNSGVVRIETEAYLACGFARRLIETRAALGRSVLSNDQVALNRIGGEIALLSPIWNFEIRFGQLDEAERFDPVLVHFTNHPKPWVHTPGFPDWPQY